MTTLDEASVLIRRVAEPRPAGYTTKAAMVRACRRLHSWTFNRVRDVWHADPRIRLRAEEIEHLREATARNEEKAAGHELSELRAKVARLERLLVQAQ